MVAPFVQPVGTAFIVVVFTIFILMKRGCANRLIRLVAPRQLNTMTQVLDDAAMGVSRYLLVQFSEHCLRMPDRSRAVFHWRAELVPGEFWRMLRFIPYIGR
jgi:hypothetical protein